LLLSNAESYLGIETRSRANNGDAGIGIETVEDSAGGYLDCSVWSELEGLQVVERDNVCM
jgi:hypothetical protein